MRKYFIICFVFMIAALFAQTPLDKISSRLKSTVDASQPGEKTLVWVYFTDKGNDLERYYSQPSLVVSDKSLKRRSKVFSEGALIKSTDLPVNENYVNQLQSLGFVVKQKSRWFNSVSGYVTKELLNQISTLEKVKKLDIVVRFHKDESNLEEGTDDVPNTQNQGLNKGNEIHSFNYGQSFTQLNQINVPAVHDMGFSGAGITICLMDAGFDIWSTHQVFSSMNVIATWDFVNGDSNVENEGDMGNGSHGTGTLSDIGGFYEGQLIGPAFGADYILTKTENTDSETPIEEDNWIAALEWADSIGVDITSTSLSYLDYDPPYTSYTWEDMDGNTALITIAADLAAGLGIFVVNSASNSGYNANHNTLGAPADGDSVVAVGAVDGSGIRAGFSSVGPTTDPPGRIKPDLMAMGDFVYVARNSGTSSYGHSSGTSFSCPILAGASALLLQADPTLTPMEMLDILRSTASQSSNPDNEYGWGIIDVLAAIQSLPTTVDISEVPENFYLLSSYPNPFNPTTKIQFQIPVESNVSITLHNVLGEQIALLYSGDTLPGKHEISLKGNDMASGIYFVRMNAENVVKTIKITLLK